MGTSYWPVVPLCPEQRLDVREEDILGQGLYRICDTYRGGGGYDQFAQIWHRRMGHAVDSCQFVVQLYGCPLSCPYCYVTPAGVHGTPVNVTSVEVLRAYRDSRLEVFHLMGGAPALYLPKWRELSQNVAVFHSDFILVEGVYEEESLKELEGLFAVSFKSRSLYTKEQLDLLWRNLDTLVACEVPFYITFTGADDFSPEIIRRVGSSVLRDSFVILIKQYAALQGREGYR